MTETGMLVSQKLHGPRASGFVGFPLEGVNIKVLDEHDNTISTEILAKDPALSGTMVVQGENVFSRYWGREESPLREDGYFDTGDVVSYSDVHGYAILGRQSVDIIKSGGYKISALEGKHLENTRASLSLSLSLSLTFRDSGMGS